VTIGAKAIDERRRTIRSIDQQAGLLEGEGVPPGSAAQFEDALTGSGQADQIVDQKRPGGGCSLDVLRGMMLVRRQRFITRWRAEVHPAIFVVV